MLSFPTHPEMAVATGEIHARPYNFFETSRIVYQLSFLDDAAGVDDTTLGNFCRCAGIEPPCPSTRHHVMQLESGSLQWERHTEFTTWTWDVPAGDADIDASPDLPFPTGYSPSGLLVSAVRVDVLGESPRSKTAGKAFVGSAQCHSQVKSGRAEIRTDFRQDRFGFTRILVVDRNLTRAGTGAIVQRLLEIETYRTLAMLALPHAQRLFPEIREIEERFTAVTGQIKDRARSDADGILTEITSLAAALEANAASGHYRLSASRAYENIVRERIQMLGETPISGFETLGSFLDRRLAPAMRTCRSLEERQATLSCKLARATSLLRSWIDIELERQNSELLRSMDRRASLQLRLQQTVEGLSVAAISYYVVGLVGYLAKWLESEESLVKASTMTALAVPISIAVLSVIVWRIRWKHVDS